MLIKGKDLNREQKTSVLAAFGYRWTRENHQRAKLWYRNHGRPRIKLISDEQWLDERAFHFLKDGSRMMLNRQGAEPAYSADFD